MNFLGEMFKIGKEFSQDNIKIWLKIVFLIYGMTLKSCPCLRNVSSLYEECSFKEDWTTIYTFMMLALIFGAFLNVFIL